jgi:N-acetylmuramoyl-L-alanine amidase
VIVAVLVVIAVAGVLVAWPRTDHALGGVHLTGSTPSAAALDPAAFADGACVAFAPTAGNKNKTVFLDAGHGGIDPGGVGTTESGQSIDESQINLPIELDAAAILRSQGYRVVVSRTGNSTVTRLTAGDTDGGVLSLVGSHNDVAARAACANLARADALVGIYMDSAGSATDAGSVSLYDADRSFTSANERLAGLLQATVISAMDAQGWQVPDDGVLPDSGFGSSVASTDAGGLAAEAPAYDHLMLIGPAMAGYFASPSEMPGAVLEPLYLTDPFEGSIAASSSGQHVVASAIVFAVEQFLAPAKKAG